MTHSFPTMHKYTINMYEMQAFFAKILAFFIV
jgi:hypothetical protein